MRKDQPMGEGENEKDFEDDEHSLPALLSVLPVITPGQSAWQDLRSPEVWLSLNLWRAGVSFFVSSPPSRQRV
jgi:hypothetical protein